MILLNKTTFNFNQGDYMPITKVTRVSETKTPKHFTGGKPKDFELKAVNGAITKAVLSPNGRDYNLTIPSGYTAFDAAALRELGEHCAELADILQNKVQAA